MSDDPRRAVSLTRLETGVYRATNAAGATLEFGSAIGDADVSHLFSPVELLLAAIGGCSAVDVDVVTGRRSAPERFEMTVEGNKVRDDDGSRMHDLAMTFHVTFPDGPDGDAARKILPQAVRTSTERTCTVSRTVEHASPIEVRVNP